LILPRSLMLGMTLPGLALALLAGVALGMGTYTFHYAEGGSYFSNDPKACVNCHIMRDVYESWGQSSHHAAATCNDCHVPHEFIPKYLVKAENGFWHSKGFTLMDFPEPIRIRPTNARVLRENCVACHRDLVNDLLGHQAAGGERSCIHCHPSVGHGPPR